MSANEKQVGGNHYNSAIQHWDYVIANDLDYFQAQVTKYVTRWKKKNGIQDLEKAMHFLEKYIESEKAKAAITNQEIIHKVAHGPVNRNARRMIPKERPFGFDPFKEGVVE